MAGIVGTLLAGAVTGGCTVHDIGRPCEPLLNDDQDPAVGDDERLRTETATVVGQDVCMPCDELICVAVDGKPGYCSKKCEDDDGCPIGFECRVLIEPDPDADPNAEYQYFAGAKFCTWLQCTTDEDCGAPEIIECRVVENSDPEKNLEICEYTENTSLEVERPACERTD